MGLTPCAVFWITLALQGFFGRPSIRPSQGRALAAARGFAERAAVGGGAMLALIGQPGRYEPLFTYYTGAGEVMRVDPAVGRDDARHFAASATTLATCETTLPASALTNIPGSVIEALNRSADLFVQHYG